MQAIRDFPQIHRVSCCDLFSLEREILQSTGLTRENVTLITSQIFQQKYILIVIHPRFFYNKLVSSVKTQLHYLTNQLHISAALLWPSSAPPQEFEKKEVTELQYWPKISEDTVCYCMVCMCVCVWEELNNLVQKYHFKTLYNLNIDYTSSKIA